VSNFGFEPLIEHFDGSSWRVVPGASILTTNHDFLLSVAGSGANDVWAVGRTFRHPAPLIEHFDGNSWTQVSQPVSGYDSALNSVAVLSSTDAWAVGEQSLNQTVTERWDGHRWTLISSPSVTDNNAQDVLAGVAALSSADVWAVGQSPVKAVRRPLATTRLARVSTTRDVLEVAQR
jgi:hypothetical protein